MTEIDLGSVVGPQGKQGEMGIQGLQGIPGEQGIQGVQGKQGEKGQDGQDGLSPHIDNATGNWFVGSVDTGVKASGRDGTSIQSIVQTTESDENGGINVITVTLSDGTTYTFMVRNGTGGSTSEGADGKDGVSVESVIQTTTSTEDSGENVITVTLSDGTQSSFKVRNGSKGRPGEKGSDGAKGEPGAKGDDGAKGFSPTVTENSGNNASTYKLDITTETGKITTPNLKGADGKDSTKTQEIIEMLGGIKFAQDADGNWGYITPGGADTVIPFKKGSGGVSGGGMTGCEIIKRGSFGQANGAGTTIHSFSAELEKDYKCFFVLLGCYVTKNTSYKYTVTPSFRDGSIVLMAPTMYPSNSLNAYNILAIAADLNQDGLKAGDTYAFSFSVYSNAAPVRYPFAMLCGFY